MFIDLNVGNIGNSPLIDSGDAKVECRLRASMTETMAFNAYAWVLNANIADGSINWTNWVSTNPSEPGQSGYSIATTATAVPEPGSIALLAVALAGFFITGGRAKRLTVPPPRYAHRAEGR